MGVCPDSVESHGRFVEKHNLRIKLLSDPDHSVFINVWCLGGEEALWKKFMCC
ncbi:MAG: redoxin domain-containing protein [archaeon GB-1867-097]|nr:redoxin domain-containing protein [Candidatus Culexmicrobium thermophilum]